MFDKKNRYITKGVQDEIPIEQQLFMWSCIDALNDQGQELDYLQVFELTKEKAGDLLVQRIEHRQEVPGYKMTYNVITTVIMEAKVFVIDDETHSTMLLADEY
jgi:hypothetical protein